MKKMMGFWLDLRLVSGTWLRVEIEDYMDKVIYSLINKHFPGARPLGISRKLEA